MEKQLKNTVPVLVQSNTESKPNDFLSVYYMQDLKGIFHRCQRSLKRLQHTGFIPKPDGTDATGHPWWHASTIKDAQRNFLGIAA